MNAATPTAGFAGGEGPPPEHAAHSAIIEPARAKRMRPRRREGHLIGASSVAHALRSGVQRGARAHRSDRENSRRAKRGNRLVTVPVEVAMPTPDRLDVAGGSVAYHALTRAAPEARIRQLPYVV